MRRVLPILFALVFLFPAFVAAQDENREGNESNTLDESSFVYRTPEEYRDAILNAFNDAQIDAFICQQLVQEMREKGENHPDFRFFEILEEPEMKLERQKRADMWRQEREKVQKNKTQMNYRVLGPVLGAIVVLFLIISVVAVARKPKTGDAADSGEK